MKWLIVTCDSSAHIRPVQEWLFRKYAPDIDLHYIDVGSEPVETWGQNVLNRLPDDLYCIFGLDDYLPVDHINNDRLNLAISIMEDTDCEYDRFELFGPHIHKRRGLGHVSVFNEKRTAVVNEILAFGPNTDYSVSCQFSIWRMQELKSVLMESTTPWNFEVKHSCRAASFAEPAFRYIEESALSGKKWPGKINVNGLPAEDVEELIKLGLLDESKLINRS